MVCYCRRTSGWVFSKRLRKLNAAIMSAPKTTYSGKSGAQPSISTGQDEGEILSGLDSLLNGGSDCQGQWTLTSDGKGLERIFQFKTFKDTWVGHFFLRLRLTKLNDKRS